MARFGKHLFLAVYLLLQEEQESFFFSISDINECELGRCKHSCENTHGSYICNCNEGYTLKFGHCVDNTSISESNLLYCDQNRIFKHNLYSNYSEILYQSENSVKRPFKISDFDFSIKKSLLFYSEYYSSSIYM